MPNAAQQPRRYIGLVTIDSPSSEHHQKRIPVRVVARDDQHAMQLAFLRATTDRDAILEAHLVCDVEWPQEYAALDALISTGYLTTAANFLQDME